MTSTVSVCSQCRSAASTGTGFPSLRPSVATAIVLAAAAAVLLSVLPQLVLGGSVPTPPL